MLKELHLQAFKSFTDEHIDLNSLTVLTGLNSSGKSSVIQALRMVDRYYRRHKSILPGYGSFKEITNKSMATPLLIEVKDDEDNLYICKEDGGAITQLFPSLIYVSASRLGPQTNITVYAEDSIMDEQGQNVLKCIEEYSMTPMNPLVVPEGAEFGNFVGAVKEWLKIISPSTTDFQYEISSISDTSFSLFNGHRAKNVGFGLSYTLPVITALLLGTVVENSIVIIENPEAHLHAKAQTEIADLIARCVEAGAQVIVETHSDHLFDGLRIYVKEHPGFEKKMNCYWFELDEDKNTEATLIELNSKGRIVNLTIPPHFMDQFEYNSQRLLFGR